jgi:hypothetical protein
MPRLLLGSDRIDPAALARFAALLRLAEKAGVYLHVTGLACYQIKDRLAWYDALDDEARWQTQAFFWTTLARVCANSPAVFCYDLINEPAASGKKSDGWYMGKMGEVEFCQRLSLAESTRPADEIIGDWTARMVAAIRAQDPRHLITLGMLPFPGTYRKAAELLDFVSPHLYTNAGQVDEELALLQKFDFGKPIVIGETFPLSCSRDEERAFLLQSRAFAHGWIGHWPDDPPAKLQALKAARQITIAQSIWLSWVELFREVGPDMTRSGRGN